jgi:hypothetical protein
MATSFLFFNFIFWEQNLTHIFLENKLPNGENSPKKNVICNIENLAKFSKTKAKTSQIYTFRKVSNSLNKQN